MRVLIALLALGFSAVTAVPTNSQRIVGGFLTTIDQYPSIVSLLFSWDGSTFQQTCGGTILNSRHVLTAAHCLHGDAVNRWRIRVGSTFANSGGIIHNQNTYILHPNFNKWILDNDIAIMRTVGSIGFNDLTQAARIAGSNYVVGERQVVFAVGWGATFINDPPSEQLRDVQIFTVDQDTCRTRYGSIGRTVTGNMLCAGRLELGGRDHCRGDNGGPLYHNGVVIGVVSWGEVCGSARFPGVYVRVSRYTAWIQSNT